MSVNRTFPVIRDTWVVRTGASSDAGNGAGSTMIVGETNFDGIERKNRALLAIACDFTGGISVSQAILRVQLDAVCLGSMGNAVKVWAERLTDSFPEGNFGGPCNWSSGNNTIYPGPSASTTNRVKYEGSPGNNATIGWTITAMTEAYRAELAAMTPPRTEGTLFLRLIAADGTTGYEEDNDNRTIQFRSRNNSNGKPRVEVVLDDNHPPQPPTIVTPVPSEDMALVEGLALKVHYRVNDEDKPDWTTGSEIQVYGVTATDDDEGNILTGSLVAGLTGTGQTTTIVAPSGSILPAGGTAQPTEAIHTVTGFVAGQQARYRLRTRDKRNVWGLNIGPTTGWTRLSDGWVELDSMPGPPSNLQVDPTQSQPDYHGLHVDPDPGSSVSAVESQVIKNTPLGVEMILNATDFHAGMDEALDSTPYSTRSGSGAEDVAGGTVWTVGHSPGRAINPGERITRRHRTLDQYDRPGKWSAWVSWDVILPTVPQAIPAPGERQGTLTPTIGATYSENFDRMQLLGWSAQDGGTQLLDTGEITVTPAAMSASVVYGDDGTAAALQYGQTIWVERRVRKSVSSEWTDYSPRQSLPIASQPRRPTVTVEGAVQRADGVWVVGTTTPRINITYRSADLPDDSPSRRILTFLAADGMTTVYTNDDTTSVPLVEAFDVPISTLVLETTYQLTVIHYNDVSVAGPSSEVIHLKVHRPPTIVTGTAPVAADPTPVATWTSTYYGTATAADAVVWVDAENADAVMEEIHRETLDGDPETYTVPADTLSDGVDVQLTVTIYDSDGLSAELSAETDLASGATFTTGAAVLTVAADVSAALPQDSFTRSVADGFGTATTGGAYTLDGTAADFDVTGTEGTMSVPVAGGAGREATLLDVSIADIILTSKWKTDKAAVGGVQRFALRFRIIDASNFYMARAEVRPSDNLVRLRLFKTVGGTQTELSAVTTAIVHGANTYLKLKAQATGTTQRAKVWLSADSEPGSWDVTASDTTQALQAAGAIGYRVDLPSTVTNAPVLFTVDDLATS